MNSFKKEVNYVASLSKMYLAEEKARGANCNGESKNSLTALIFTFNSDLLPMLMATEHRMDRLPIVYLEEANA